MLRKFLYRFGTYSRSLATRFPHLRKSVHLRCELRSVTGPSPALPSPASPSTLVRTSFSNVQPSGSMVTTQVHAHGQGPGEVLSLKVLAKELAGKVCSQCPSWAERGNSSSMVGRVEGWRYQWSLVIGRSVGSIVQEWSDSHQSKSAAICHSLTNLSRCEFSSLHLLLLAVHRQCTCSCQQYNDSACLVPAAMLRLSLGCYLGASGLSGFASIHNQWQTFS